MKAVYCYLSVLIFIALSACTNNKISGIYICDQSHKKTDTTIHHGSFDQIILDLTCAITQFNFKGNTTVEVTTQGGAVVTSYVIDKDYIRIKGSGSDILLKRKDQNTLISEGPLSGTYTKK